MNGAEFPLQFTCASDPLIGIVHPGADDATMAVVVVVGGPQYRAGSHRQFTHLARHISAGGIPTFRFDMRGMGDSGGEFPGFESVDADIRAAIDALISTAPAIRRVVLWGLCDGASAITFYAHSDPRIAGAVLLNPWIRTDATHAQAQLKHYYARRIFTAEFWRRLMSGSVDLKTSLRDFMKNFRQARRAAASGPAQDDSPTRMTVDSHAALPERMRQGLAAFSGRVLMIISGNDLTAQEFDDVTGESPEWKSVLQSGKLERFDLPGADHTCSKLEWAEAVAEKSVAWCRDLSAFEKHSNSQGESQGGSQG